MFGTINGSIKAVTVEISTQLSPTPSNCHTEFYGQISAQQLTACCMAGHYLNSSQLPATIPTEVRPGKASTYKLSSKLLEASESSLSHRQPLES